MKCIRMPDGNGGLKVVRCSDRYASLAVSNGAATYATKIEWKVEGRCYVQ